MSGPWADRNVAWVDYDAAWQPRTAAAPLGRAAGTVAVWPAASVAAGEAGLDRAGAGLAVWPALPVLAAVARPGRTVAAGGMAPARGRPVAGPGVCRARAALWAGSIRVAVAAPGLIRALAGLFAVNPCGVDQPVRTVARLASAQQGIELAGQKAEVGAWHVCMHTYWKSIRYRIAPPEPHAPPVLLRIGKVAYIETRNVAAEKHEICPPEMCLCHHMSYAWPDEMMRKKHIWYRCQE